MINNEKMVSSEDKKDWIDVDTIVDFDKESAKRARQAEIQKRKALALGVEPFNAEEALKYYYPDELTGDEERIKKIMAGFESDYYYSGARTLKEWAEEREKYDVYKDSTGHDQDV